eukprot:46074-Eustigmatos_ZCMA.PRE.1
MVSVLCSLLPQVHERRMQGRVEKHWELLPLRDVWLSVELRRVQEAQGCAGGEDVRTLATPPIDLCSETNF